MSDSDGPNPSGLCQCGCGQRTPIAKKTKAKHGHVAGRPVRFIHNHHTRLSGSDYIVDPVTGCWVWQRAKSGGGYGHIWVNGRVVPAHRHFYEQKHGPIPDGLDACHSCDNPGCCNPDHVFPGTRSENVLDSVRKGRWGTRPRKAVAA